MQLMAEEETSMRMHRGVAAGLLAAAILTAGSGFSQHSSADSATQQQQQGLPPMPMPPIEVGRGHVDIAEKQAIAMNNDRQKKLVADTEKLLALANELKMDVDKSSKDTLSLDVIKKADEIEKLAHSVKERMKG